jgi:cysteine desulfurase
MGMRTYLDWNATTPPLLEALDAMRDTALLAWGNPASIHGDGRRARAHLEDARAHVASLVGVDPRDVLFTSGGTEANNLALRSVKPGATIATSRLEHPSITRVAEALEREKKARILWLEVTEGGVVDLAHVTRVLDEDKPELLAVQAINHETGIVQPLRELIDLAHQANVRVHVDAVQAWGKCVVPSGWDTASVASHKIRGPKGIGALVMRQGTTIVPVLRGGSQERGLRPGTVDAALAAGFGVAARTALNTPKSWAELAHLRDTLEKALLALPVPSGSARVVGDPSLRASHVSTLLWPGWTGGELVAALDLEGVSVSSGAACSAGTVEPSPVLAAMLGDSHAHRGVRASLGVETTREDIERAILAYTRVLLRA